MTEYKWMLFYSKTFKSFSLSLSADLKWVRVNELYTVMCKTKSSHLSLKWFITGEDCLPSPQTWCRNCEWWVNMPEPPHVFRAACTDLQRQSRKSKLKRTTKIGRCVWYARWDQKVLQAGPKAGPDLKFHIQDHLLSFISKGRTNSSFWTLYLPARKNR